LGVANFPKAWNKDRNVSVHIFFPSAQQRCNCKGALQSTTEMDAARKQLNGKARAASETSVALTSARTEASAARAECRRLSDLLSARERDVHATHADVERASAAAADLAARLTARSEEAAALRRDLETTRKAAAAAQRARDELVADVAAAAEGRTAALAAANGAGGHARVVAGRLEEAEARAAALQEALDKREQEVCCCLFFLPAVSLLTLPPCPPALAACPMEDQWLQTVASCQRLGRRSRGT
jgi:chromosome segregation ATPase